MALEKPDATSFTEGKSMFSLGTPELILIMILVILLFGAGRIGRLGGEIGQSIRQFKHELGRKDEQ